VSPLVASAPASVHGSLFTNISDRFCAEKYNFAVQSAIRFAMRTLFCILRTPLGWKSLSFEAENAVI
jgi:hypothetical protein